MTFHPPRGLSPELLVSQVKNTAPYLFEGEGLPEGLTHLEPVGHLRKIYASLNLTSTQATRPESSLELSHFEYFKLCLCAHYLSCATPVPTDVDHQIRFKLWHEKLPIETTLEMAQLVLKSRTWDFRGISQRYVYGSLETAWGTEVLSGHLGEWFTVACAAYSALGRSKDPTAQKLREQILVQIIDEIHRHAEIFASLWSSQDGLGCLRASALIAHNFGDLDRVMDLWELTPIDPLRAQFYNLTSEPLDSHRKLRYRGRLWLAGEVYKSEILTSSMAAENHRHFALRKPRALRQSPKFLIPLAPFFDDWGQSVAQTLNHSNHDEDLLEISAALTQGWERLSQPVGYGRALYGIFSVKPEIRDELPTLTEILKTKKNRKLFEMSQQVFESQWSSGALQKMEEIPSRL